MGDYLKSFLNYTGSKNTLLDQILPIFPKKYTRFIDLFSGSGTVAINEAALTGNKNIEYVLNDINCSVISILSMLDKYGEKKFLSIADDIIEEYELSSTIDNGYNYYGVNSSNGLSSVNKESYKKLRLDFNEDKIYRYEKEIILYVLIAYGFNNQIRFNQKGKFNLPVGKRDLNKSMRKKLVDVSNVLDEYKFSYSNKDFIDFQFQKGDFVYCDPPYLIGNASYNENGLWSERDELNLLTMLSELDNNNTKFALSNVLVHNGKTNDILIKWAQSYNIHYLNKSYNNSNYQSKAKNSITKEVLITNY